MSITKSVSKKNIHGYSLVELSLVILILGLIISLLYIYYPKAQQVQKQLVKSFNTDNIDNAILGFSYSHGRLPFPDSNGSGVENIGATRGTIPEVTLGLAEKPVNESNIPLVYSIFRKEDNTDPRLDADLGINKDRLYAFLPSGTRTAAEIALNQTNTIDFCFALRTAANISTYESGSLHVSESGPTYNKNVAYVLVDVGFSDADGDGQLLDGLNVSGLNFEVASKPQSPSYDDKVNSRDFSELFGSLACGSVISAALHAHDNVVLAADMMQTSFIDYSNLLDLTEDLAEADVLLAGVVIAQALAGIANLAAEAATAVAQGLVAVPPLTILAAAATAPLIAAGLLTAAATTLSAFTLVEANIAKDKITAAKSCFNSGGSCVVGSGNFLTNSAALTVSIRANAVAADAAGL